MSDARNHVKWTGRGGGIRTPGPLAPKASALHWLSYARSSRSLSVSYPCNTRTGLGIQSVPNIFFNSSSASLRRRPGSP